MVFKYKNILRCLKCTAVHKIIEVLQDIWSTKITNYQVHVSSNGHETILNFPAKQLLEHHFSFGSIILQCQRDWLADKNFEKLILLKSDNAYKWNIVIAMSLKVTYLSDVLEMYLEVLYFFLCCTWYLYLINFLDGYLRVT